MKKIAALKAVFCCIILLMSISIPMGCAASPGLLYDTGLGQRAVSSRAGDCETDTDGRIPDGESGKDRGSDGSSTDAFKEKNSKDKKEGKEKNGKDENGKAENGKAENGKEEKITEKKEKSRYEIDKKYQDMLAKADDENDFRYANDYRESTRIFVFGHDASSYKAIFGYSNPSEQEIFRTIENNSGLTSEDKNFIKEFVRDWQILYPGSDFTVLNHNLTDLKIERLSSDVIKARTLSSGTVACYIDGQNVIYLDETAVISDKASNDYVALVHELIHACRMTKTKIGDVTVKTNFYDDSSFGLYENEALATYYAFKMRQYHVPDAEMKSIYYTLQCSIYRMILSLIDYDGTDYMNHSINYFVEKIQNCFDENGIKIKAYHFVNLVDSQALIHYQPYMEPDFEEFGEEIQTLTDLYASVHLNPNMTDGEIHAEFNLFWDDLSFNLDKLTVPYEEMKKETFKEYWDAYVEKMKNSTG